MNPIPVNSAPGSVTARTASAACPSRPADSPFADQEDAAPPDALAPVPVAPPPMLAAWQAALQAREPAPPVSAGGLTSASLTQQALAGIASGHGAVGEQALPGDARAAAAPVRVEAEFRTEGGAAWQLSLHRGPQATAWNLDLATSAVPAAWAAHQLPRLERRLRLQGHGVDQLGWQPLPGRDPQEEPR